MSSQDLSSYASSSLGSEEEGLDDEERGVAVAQPPRGSSPHAAEAALGVGDALEILDQLVASNQLGKERAARLRRKYNHLREALESSRSVESSLLIQAKDLGQHLSQQQHLLEKGGTFPEGESSETTRMRQILLQHQNELDRTQERLEKLDYHIQLLEEEKMEVDREWSRMPKKEEVEQHMRELQRQAEELRDEISLRSQDIRRYHEDLDRRTYRLTSILQDMEEIGRQEEGFQDQLVQLRASGNIPREIDAVRKQKKDVEGRTRELEAFLGELGSQQREVEGRMSAVVEELRQSQLEVTQLRGEVQSREVELERLNKDIALAREREASLLEDRPDDCHYTFQWHTPFACQSSKFTQETECKDTKVGKAVFHPQLLSMPSDSQGYTVTDDSGRTYHINFCAGLDQACNGASVCRDGLSNLGSYHYQTITYYGYRMEIEMTASRSGDVHTIISVQCAGGDSDPDGTAVEQVEFENHVRTRDGHHYYYFRMLTKKGCSVSQGGSKSPDNGGGGGQDNGDKGGQGGGDKKRSSSNGAQIAGAIVAVLIITVLVAILAALLLYKRERREVIVQIAMKAFGPKSSEPIRYRKVTTHEETALLEDGSESEGHHSDGEEGEGTPADDDELINL